jgi:rare lipoprotein A
MRLRLGFRTKTFTAAASLLAGCALWGVAQARPDWHDLNGDGTVPQQPIAQDPEVLSQEAKMYDEVGQVVWPGADSAVGEGATLGPSGVWIAHPSLPVPSYVEITRLDTGRTVVARVSARPALGRASALAELSAGAARQLLLDPVGQAPLRIRAANPTDQEKAALRMGQVAGDRMDTPEALLVVLRKKAGAQAAVKTASRAATEVQPSPRPRVKAPVAPAQSNPGPRASTGPHWVVTGDDDAGEPQAEPFVDGFVVEQAGQRRATPAPRWQRPAPAPQPTYASDGYYVQVAALSTRWKAQQVAKQIGGGVQPAGNLFRVRKGPYPSEAAARAALGPLAAKGYRDARITR